MRSLRTFFMEDILEGTRFAARFNLAESGSRPSTVADLLGGAGLDDAAAAAALLGTSLRDSPNWGRADLRGLVSDLHPGSTAEQVLITTGTSEALFLLFRALRPRRTALVWPAFQLLYEIPASLGSALVRLPVRWSSGGAPFFELSEWTDLLDRERPDCVVLNFPHNPSGLVPTPEVLDALVERARAIGATVIGDEHYRFLASEATSLGPTVFRDDPAVFVTGSYIKCLGCPGLRIGWCVGSNLDILGAMQSEKNYLTHTVNPLSERISVEVLRDLSAPIWAEHRRIWLENRRALTRFLVGSSSLVGAAPAGGLVTSLGFSRARGAADVARSLDAIREAGVGVLPLDAMEVTATSPAASVIERGFGVRIGLGSEPTHFAAALEALEEACAGAAIASSLGEHAPAAKASKAT